MNFTIVDIIIVIAVVVVGVGAALYFLNRWASKRTVEHNNLVENTRQPAEIYVIDKKMGKIMDANLPKAALEQVPRLQKIMKTPLVKAKVGPQIVTLMCDKRVYKALPVKKSVKIELAGMYIVSIKGSKHVANQKAAKEESKKWKKSK